MKTNENYLLYTDGHEFELKRFIEWNMNHFDYQRVEGLFLTANGKKSSSQICFYKIFSFI